MTSYYLLETKSLPITDINETLFKFIPGLCFLLLALSVNVFPNVARLNGCNLWYF